MTVQQVAGEWPQNPAKPITLARLSGDEARKVRAAMLNRF